MLSNRQKKIIAVVVVGVFLITFGSFLISNGTTGYDGSVANVYHQNEYSSQSHVANNLIQKNNAVVQKPLSLGNILQKPVAATNERKPDTVSKNFISSAEYNITIHETGLNLSFASWQTQLDEIYGAPPSCFTFLEYTSTESTINIRDVSLCSLFNYELVFAVGYNGTDSNYLPLHNLNIKFSPTSGEYNFSYTVNFPALYLESFTFTDASSSGTYVSGTISFNNTSTQIAFSEYEANYFLVLPAGHYDLVFIYNFSKANIAITVSGKASYSITFPLYTVKMAIYSKYSLYGDEVLLEATTLNLSFSSVISLAMQPYGNNTFVVHAGNGSFTFLLVFPLKYSQHEYCSTDTLKYALAQGVTLSGEPLNLTATSPALTTHLVTFTGVSGTFGIILRYHQPYACGMTDGLYYNSTTGTVSENITTLASPVLIDAIFQNFSLFYTYQESYYSNSVSGANITIALHRVSVTANDTVAGSVTCFAFSNQIPANPGTSLFGSDLESFFSIGADNATFYLPSSGFQIQVKNEYSNLNGCLAQTFTDNITSSTQTVNVDFLEPHNISLSLVLKSVPAEFSHSTTIYGSVNGIKFTSTSDTNYFISPYANVSVDMSLESLENQLDLSYSSSFYTDISTNSLVLTIPPIYLHTIEITNPVLDLKGNYTFELVTSKVKVSSLNFLNPYTHLTYNISASVMTINSGSGRNLNITFIAPNGSFYAFAALVQYASPSLISGLSSLSYSFFYIGTVDLSSSTILSDKISIPEMTLATVEINMNGLPFPYSFSTFSSSSGNYSGFVFAASIYSSESLFTSGFVFPVNNASFQVLLPVSASVHVTMYSDTPFVLFDPEYQSCSVSNHTDYHTGLVMQKGYVVVNKYDINFIESGLPSGTSWAVTFNGTTNESDTNTITFTSTNGSYQFTVSSISGYTVTPASGTTVVNGSSVTEEITFAVKPAITKYQVAFIETGLPSGTSWSVTVDGMTNSSTSNTIGFLLPDGNYSFTTSNNAGYSASGPTTVKVDGSNVTVNLSFSKTSVTTPPPPHVSVSISPIIIYAIVAIAVVGVIGFVFRAMRKR